MTVLPVMRHMAKNHQTNLHDLQPSDFFSRSKTQRDFTVNNSRHSTQCDKIPTCVAGTRACVR
jgi:hypothetical protein